jgi:hypothetical protein
MNQLVIVIFVLTFGLFGCVSTYQPVFVADIVDIQSTELEQYWLRNTTKPNWSQGRPKWLPKGNGIATYSITIDSNGLEVSKELIESTPEDWMTQKHLDTMPVAQYTAAKTNITKTPVKVAVLAKITPLKRYSNQ